MDLTLIEGDINIFGARRIYTLATNLFLIFFFSVRFDSKRDVFSDFKKKNHDPQLINSRGNAT